MTTFHLPIERFAAVPIHRQIYEAFRRAILNGLFDATPVLGAVSREQFPS